MRPIDADALPVCKEHCIDECGFSANFYVVHKTDIDAAPTITIEAEPVKHGKRTRLQPGNNMDIDALTARCGTTAIRMGGSIND